MAIAGSGAAADAGFQTEAQREVAWTRSFLQSYTKRKNESSRNELEIYIGV